MANLVEKGEDPVGFDIEDVDEALVPGGYTFVRGDIGNYEDVIGAIQSHSVERVIVLSYIMAPLFSPDYTDFLGAVNVNLVGVTNVFEAARRSGLDRVVLGSSVGVYGTPEQYGDTPVNEESPLTAPNLYGRMKMVNESIADKYRQVHGLDIPKVRPTAIFGVGNTMWPTRLISPVAIGEAGSAPFATTSRNNAVAVEDLAELYRLITVKDRLEHDTYVAAGHNFVVTELVDAIRSWIPDAELNFDETAPPPAYPTTYDNSRAVKEFDWRLHSLEESVLLHINSERARHNLEPLEPR
jgi:UDP-glucose 4-epimerase